MNFTSFTYLYFFLPNEAPRIELRSPATRRITIPCVPPLKASLKGKFFSPPVETASSRKNSQWPTNKKCATGNTLLFPPNFCSVKDRREYHFIPAIAWTTTMTAWQRKIVGSYPSGPKFSFTRRCQIESSWN